MGICGSVPEARDTLAAASLSRTQSVMDAAYEKSTIQTGFTDGHHCVATHDHRIASERGASLLYGEILPQGVMKLLDDDHMRAGRADVMLDLGSGTGKVCMQAFLTYTNLTRVVGIELSASRFQLGESACVRLASQSMGYTVAKRVPGELIVLEAPGVTARRQLELRKGDMWSMRAADIEKADILIMHTDFTQASIPHFKRVLGDMRRGARFVTYQDLRSCWRRSEPPFQQLDKNLDETDTFLTSWSASRGHHLYCYEKHVATRKGYRLHPDDVEETKENMGRKKRADSSEEEEGRPQGDDLEEGDLTDDSGSEEEGET